MSGMKFRCTCAMCNVTFFSPDRKARYCPKCSKKRPVKPLPGGKRVAIGAPPDRTASQSAPPAQKKPMQQPPKASELTPELCERLKQIYWEKYASSGIAWREMVTQIAGQLQLSSRLIASALHKMLHSTEEIPPQLQSRVIEMYQGFVMRGERPPEGRRRAISRALKIPYQQVKNLVYEWGRSQYAQSPTPQPSRQQLFTIEKLYWAELDQPRYPLSELPIKLAEQLGDINAWQVARWLDTLHEDDRKFANVADVSPELEQRILEAYQQYLAAPQPPEQSLHHTIANQIGGITTRQVHKVLQRFRNQQRAAYPLR